MKKLIAMIGAVAMSFGLFADDATPFTTSFDTGDAGVNGTEYTSAQAGWLGLTDPLTLKAYDTETDPAYVYTTDRRFAKDNLQYLPLETERTNALNHAVGEGNIFVDQLVRFTGFDEAQTNLAAGTKIAVWMGELVTNETDTAEFTATNLYVTVGSDYLEGQIAVKLDGTYEIGKWYRLTIKSLGDIFDEGGASAPRAGFCIWIDGVKKSIAADDTHVNNLIQRTGQLKATAASAYAKSQLFPAISSGSDQVALGTFGYSGIGAIDDIYVDDVGPEFTVEEYTFTVPGNDKVSVVSVFADEEELTPPYKVAPNTEVTITYAAKDGYKIRGAATQTATIDAPDMEVEVDEEQVTILDVVATVTNGQVVNGFAEDELYGMINNLTHGDTAAFFKACDITNVVEEVEVVLYSVTSNTTITVDDGDWIVFVGNYLDEGVATAGIFSDYVGTTAGMRKMFTFENAEEGMLLLGADVAGAVETGNGCAVVMADLTVAGILKATALAFDESNPKITLSGSGNVLVKEDDTLLANFLPVNEVEVVGPDADDFYTYQIKTAPDTFTVEFFDAANGSATITPLAGTSNFVANTEIEVIATPAVGYEYAAESYEGWEKQFDGTLTTNVTVTANATFTAPNATIKTFTLTLNDAVDGSATIAADVTNPVNYGTKVTITATAAKGYKYTAPVEGWELSDGKLVKIIESMSKNEEFTAPAATKCGFAVIIADGDEVLYDTTVEALLAVQAAEGANRVKVIAYGAGQVIGPNGQTLTLAAGDTIIINNGTWTFGQTIVGTVTLEPGKSITAAGIAAGAAINVPAGYKLVTTDNHDGTFTYTAEAIAYVAQVGEQKFETLAEAVAAAQTTDTVTLLANITLDATLEITKTTAINLAGYEITFADALTKGINTANGSGTLTISNGFFAVTDTRANIAKSRAIMLNQTSGVFTDLVIDLPGFEYVLDQESNLADRNDYWNQDPAWTLDCDNVAITGNGSLFHIENSIATLTGCAGIADTTTLPSFGGAHEAAIYSSCGSIVTVNGGNFIAPNALQTGNLGGDIVVTDGTFSGNIKSYMYKGDERYLGNEATIEIVGGTFNGDFAYATDQEDECTKDEVIWDIEGGTFAVDPSAYLNEGYAAIKSGDVWNVGEAIIATFKVEGEVVNAQTNIVKFTPVAPEVQPPAGKTFTGWAPTVGEISASTEFVAQFEAILLTATFKDYDGTVLYTEENIPYNTKPTYSTEPTRTGYTFTGWNPEVAAIKVDTIYTATYEANNITITVNYDESIETLLIDGQPRGDGDEIALSADTKAVPYELVKDEGITIPVFYQTIGGLKTKITANGSLAVSDKLAVTFSAKDAASEDVTDAEARAALKDAGFADATLNKFPGANVKNFARWVENHPATGGTIDKSNYVRASVALDVDLITEATEIKIADLEEVAGGAMTFKVKIETTTMATEAQLNAIKDMVKATKDVTDWATAEKQLEVTATADVATGTVTITPTGSPAAAFMRVVIPTDVTPVTD